MRHPYEILKERIEAVLLPRGFAIQVEKQYPEVFGSSYCVFTRRELEVRLVWDGKDGVGFVEARTGGKSTWRPAGRILSKADMEDPEKSASLITSLESDLRNALSL